MWIYEVNAEVKQASFGSYKTWLRPHMAEVLQSEGFHSAEVFQVESEVKDHVNLCIQYRVRSRLDLENYLNHRAPQLRAEGERLFSGQVRTHRRVLAPLANATESL